MRGRVAWVAGALVWAAWAAAGAQPAGEDAGYWNPFPEDADAGPAQPEPADAGVSLAPPQRVAPLTDAGPAEPAGPAALRWGVPVSCAVLPARDGKPPRAVRFQCDHVARVCLVSDNVELDGSGAPTPLELSRVQPCDSGSDLEALQRQGFRVVPATAETPPGWVRDERNRVMQFNFDMHRRIWIGGGYAPSFWPNGFVSDGEAEFGTRIDWLNDDGDTLYRLHLLEGRIDPVRGLVDGRALEWDYSRKFAAPAIRITTFVGQPRRLDMNVNVGAWVMAGRVESFTRSSPASTYITILAADPTLDLWRSDDLESYLRLRAGVGLGYDVLTRRYAFAPNAGLDFESILDRDGFHRLFANVEYDLLLLLNNGPLSGTGPPNHLSSSAGYELILLAINDQPLSAVVQARLAYRDDVPGATSPWDVSGLAGLRFSFWAPARRTAAERGPTGAR